MHKTLLSIRNIDATLLSFLNIPSTLQPPQVPQPDGFAIDSLKTPAESGLHNLVKGRGIFHTTEPSWASYKY